MRTLCIRRPARFGDSAARDALRRFVAGRAGRVRADFVRDYADLRETGADRGGCAARELLGGEENRPHRRGRRAAKRPAYVDARAAAARTRSRFSRRSWTRPPADKDVRAVVLRINSPGGGVTATDLMYGEVLRFRAQTGKPVIAAMLDVAASGGYYLACAADTIYAQPTTVTGSIGVIMMAPEFAGTMQKIGVRVNVIKSGEMKDMGSPFREMNEQDRAVLQGLIDGMYARFLDVVAECAQRRSSPSDCGNWPTAACTSRPRPRSWG